MGLKNYITLFATDLPKYFSNTLILWIIGLVPQIAVSLLLAAWFTDLRLKLKGQTFFKTVIYMPNLIMASAFAMLFFALFSDNGPVNAVLLSMGWIKTPISFLNTVWGNRGLDRPDELPDVVRQHHHHADGSHHGRGPHPVRGRRAGRLHPRTRCSGRSPFP